MPFKQPEWPKMDVTLAGPPGHLECLQKYAAMDWMIDNVNVTFGPDQDDVVRLTVVPRSSQGGLFDKED